MDPIHSTPSSIPPQNIQTPARSSPKESLKEIAVSNSKAENVQGQINSSKLASSDQAKKSLPSESFFSRIIEFVKSKFKAIFHSENKITPKSHQERWGAGYDKALKDLNTAIEDLSKEFQTLNSKIESYDDPLNKRAGEIMAQLQKLNNQRDELTKHGLK